MAPEQKSDIVCAFHGDLELRLQRIEDKIDGIHTQLNTLNLWRAKVIGTAAGVAGAISLIMDYIIK
jgi:hypothetical protein